MDLILQTEKKAIESLSDILWGFTSKECLPILNEFLAK